MLLLTVWLLGLQPVVAQVGTISEERERAEALITASYNDSALVVLQHALDRLTETEQHYGRSGLMIRLTRTHALSRQREYSWAAEELLPLIDDSRRTGHYYIQAAASLRMALIYEKQNDPGNCLRYLDKACYLIERHDIYALEPTLFNRQSSYFRVYGDTLTAQRYAWEALLLAEERKDKHQQALAHYYLSLLSRNTEADNSEYHLDQAAKYYHHTGSAVDYLVMMLGLGDLRYRAGRIAEALEATDSAMVYVSRVENRDSTYWPRIYQLRANLLRAIGEQDSAWYYLNLAHDASVEQLEEMASQRAAEVESKYSNDKQALLIAHQNQQLEYKRRREQWMWGTIAIVLAALSVLFLYYYRLTKANTLLNKQARTIQERNDDLAVALNEQRMLQGEVHHRVKNNLQIIISLLELQREELPDTPTRDALASMAGRVYSMAAVHETLYQDGQLGQIEFGKYVRKICDHFSQLSRLPTGCEYHIDIPECWLNLETAIPLGTILNELLTNSYKYGVLPERRLRISITLEDLRGEYCLQFRDNGPGFAAGRLQERVGGLGTYLLHGMSEQLRGRVVTRSEQGALTQVYFRKKNDLQAARERRIQAEYSDIVP